MKSWIILAALLLLAPAAVHAQGVTTSSIWGKVTDQQGTSLPGANIVATHLPSGSEYGTISDLDGNFRIPNMRVGGPYEVVISYVGFESYTQNGITLVLGQSHAIGAMLSESAVLLDEVTVIGLGGVFDADRTGIASNIDEQLIQVAPSMGRDIADFARLTPQAYVINDDDDGPAISIAGQNNRFNTIYIDGAVNNDVFGLSAQGTNGGQTGATPISIDAIEEFQINIAPFDVTQSGFTGGAINAITRSGTNVFEGSAYYYLRNQTLVGKTPTSDPTLTRERLADFSNQRYGIRLGGPIVKNKLFFFASGELLRSESPRPFNAGEYRGASASRLAEIQTVLQNELGYDAGDFGAKAASLDDNKLLGKIDWNISRDHKLSLRHSYSQSDNTDEFASTASTINFRNNGIIFPNTTNSTTMELNSLFGTRVANKLLLGYTRVKDDRGVAGRPFPSVSITDGAGSISLGPEPFSTANLLEQDIFTITNNLNLFSGRHTFTLGTHNEFYDIGNLFIPYNYGWYFYDSVDDFLESVRAVNDASLTPAGPSLFQRGFSLVDNVIGDGSKAIGAFKAMQLGVYVQDEFQVNSQLRLTAGVRVDVPQITTDPRFAPDVLTTTIPAVEQYYDLQGAQPGKTPKAQPYISPRFGFNYDVSGDKTTQIRGGAGVFLGRVPFVWPGGMFLNNGTNTGEVSATALPDGGAIPFVPDPDNALDVTDFGRQASELVPSGRLEIFANDFRYPQVFRTSLAVDHEIGAGWIGTLEGQYTKTLNNIVVTNYNRKPASTFLDGPDTRPVFVSSDVIDSRYSAIHWVGNTSDGYSFDVTGRLQKQFGDHWYASFSYTYGDAFAVNDGTSSQLNSLWRFVENVDTANDPGMARSDFSLGSRVLALVSYRKEFLNNLATTFSLYYAGESGRPFSYSIGNSSRLVNEGGRNSSLFFIPESASDLVFTDYDGLTPAQQASQLETFINNNDYLSSHRGEYADRNGDRTPFESILDLKIAQELFGNVAGRRQKVEVTLDIFNLTNLLNKDWGRRYLIPSDDRGDVGRFAVVRFERFQDAANGDYTPVYTFRNGDITDQSDLFNTELNDIGTYSSRWQIQFGVRYTF